MRDCIERKAHAVGGCESNDREREEEQEAVKLVLEDVTRDVLSALSAANANQSEA